MRPIGYDAKKLLLVRTLHTVIYVGLAVSVVYILVSGLLGLNGPYLFAALGLIGIEVVVFILSGMKCPLTVLAKRYGAPKGYAFDTFLPETIAKNTFRIFGVLLAVGLVLLLFRTVKLF